MDAETRDAIDGLGQGLRAEMRAGFARMDRYFELGQAQHLQLASEVRDGFAAVDHRFDGVESRFAAVDQRFERVEGRLDHVEGRLDRLESRMESIESELRSFRDWVDVQLAELRTWIRVLISRV